MSRSDGKATNPQTKQIGSFAADAARDMNLGFEPVQTFIRDGSRVAAFKAGVTELLTEEFLGTEAPAPAAASSVWTPNRTIQIGTCRNKQAMLAALKAAGRRVGLWASSMLLQVKYSPKARSINLVWPSVSELGLGNWAMVEETFNRGLKRGLELCEWEDGPQLAAQYLDQPYGEVLYMAMTPILNPYGLLCRFSVGHGDDGQWLDGGYKYPKDGFRGHDRLVFRCK